MMGEAEAQWGQIYFLAANPFDNSLFYPKQVGGGLEGLTSRSVQCNN